MRNNDKLIPVIASTMIFFSCADENIAEFNVDMPQDIAQYQYLNKYEALKNYVDRNASPGFKLGQGITVSDFLKEGLVYSVACENFDEVTAGNAQKYSSVVGDDGTMNFGTVTKFVETARNAGITIYGHTLCWHSQQNNTYLNNLIADRVVSGEPTEPSWQEIIANGDCEGSDLSAFVSTATIAGSDWDFITPGADGTGRALKVVCTSVGANDWDTQFFIAFEPALEQGKQYRFKMDIKADDACSFGSQAHIKPQEYKHWDMLGSVSATTEWKTFSKDFTASSDQAGALSFAFNLANTATTYYFDNISLEIYDDGQNNTGVITTNEYVINHDFESGTDDWGGWGNGSSNEHATGEGYEGSNCLKITNPSETTFWSAQIAYDFSEPLINGEVYYLSLKVKGTQSGILRSGFQNPDDYSSAGDFSNVNVTTNWQELTMKVTAGGDNAKRFLFSYGDYPGSIWIDDIAIYYEKSGNSVSLSDEEKKEILTDALEIWIKGMLDACDGYVKVWDVVNEPMSDWPDQYQLKTGIGKDDPDNFYWQDYLGKEYARDAVRFARLYGPDNMLLFINEYGLEGTDNNKCKGLIEMIRFWESDGETVIDGIGSQMHVNYYLDTEKQAENEKNVVGMLELLKETGKLIKISELDMGIVDQSGTSLKTVNVTFEQHMQMAGFYEFIVRKYFEIIPASQRYGITQWAPTDSPENSFWRKGEPIGLWTEDYIRKPAYGGFADGLQGY